MRQNVKHFVCSGQFANFFNIQILHQSNNDKIWQKNKKQAKSVFQNPYVC